ncbi:NUDIX domain-containing protein [Candidatus Microgenomates bacterium]|jgi:8-oxo-dGTP diphosphatase|nr:MAG: NUDIX domain-containing protein [Candidatus Microgenomates bacterium]
MTRISVKALIVKGNNVLLLKPKNLQGSFKGWDGPGGHVEEGEPILEALKREVLEETKLIIDKAYPIKIMKVPGVSTDYMIFLCTVINDEVILSPEHTEYTWMDISSFNKFLGEYLREDLRFINEIVSRLLE